MASRPEIIDAIVPPDIAGLALDSTQRLIGEPIYCTAKFRGRRYVVSEIPGADTNTILITEESTGFLVAATALFDKAHQPSQISVNLTLGNTQYTQKYERSPHLRTVIPHTPTIEVFTEDQTEIATYLLYVAARTLAVRRAITGVRSINLEAKGTYENNDFKELPEYPNYSIPYLNS